MQHAQANPAGGVAIHGQATFDSSQPNRLLITTQNGAGTSHSAINWQSFSIPTGSSTRIEQPNALSTSINRVVTNTPSTIFGTLSSNGKVVVVNQSGIAVGKDAVVDTAGFTASALGMTQGDAVSGRLRFGSDQPLGAGEGVLSVQGNLIARGGDVVLIAPSIELAKTAVVESQTGSVVLAAGKSVEVTGRGLEGITMTVQAPADQVLNLGTLKGDAVGIFAGSLKHSGLIQATQATVDGGKVVLKASGDALVEGNGQVLATGVGGKGGSIAVVGNRVALADNAQIDASGTTGGGTVLIGGDAHGANASIVNSQKTYVGAGTTLKADALLRGDGGKVVVWSDQATQFNGHISAKGGAQSGNGGWVETSGKQVLGFVGKVDTTAPKGSKGTLLLDPTDITIINTASTPTMTLTSGVFSDVVATNSILSSTDLETALGSSNITVNTASGLGGSGTITVSSPVTWASGTSLKLIADNAININADITGTGFIGLKAGSGGITNGSTSASTSASQLEIISGGSVSLTGVNAIRVDTLAASVSGSLTLDGTAPNSGLTIGTVGSTTGLSASGNLSIAEYGTGKNLQVNASVSSGGTISMNGGNGTANISSGKSVSGVDTQFFAAGAVTVNGSLSGSSSVNLHSSGSSISGSGSVSGPVIVLQNDPALVGAIGSAGSPLNTSGGDVYIGASSYGPSAVYLSHSGNLNLKSSNTQSSAPIKISASGNLNLYTPVSSSAAGDAIVLVTGGGFNDGGNDLLTSGRWLVYSVQPSSNTLTASGANGVKFGYAFQQYGASYGSTVLGTGNGVLYSTSPTLISSPATVTKEFDGTTAVNFGSVSFNVGGAAISNLATGVGIDVLTPTGTAVGNYDTKNVGTNKAVSISGITISAFDSGGKPVYGYAMPALIGEITPRALSTWTGAVSNLWSAAGNWDVMPESGNVLSVSIPPGAGNVVIDTGDTELQSLTSARTVVFDFGRLQINKSFTTTGFSQGGGTVTGAGTFKVDGSFIQAGGSISTSSIDITQANSSLTFSGLQAPTVTLTATNGQVLQTGGVVAGTLVTSSKGGTVLNGPGNQVGSWKATNTGSGNIEWTNLGVVNVQGIENSGGSVVVNNTGGISTTGPVSSQGSVSITANSPLTIGSSGVTAGGDIVLTATNQTSAGNLTLDGPVTSTGGSVALNAASDMVQNGVVYGVKGVTAVVGGNLTMGPGAKSGAAPVTYTVAGRTASPPAVATAPSGVPVTTTPSVPTPTPVPIPDPNAPPVVTTPENGVPPTGTPSTNDRMIESVVQSNLVSTFLDKFEVALQDQASAKPGKDKDKIDFVVEGEVCRP